jgi:hypothetical protein
MMRVNAKAQTLAEVALQDVTFIGSGATTGDHERQSIATIGRHVVCSTVTERAWNRTG